MSTAGACINIHMGRVTDAADRAYLSAAINGLENIAFQLILKAGDVAGVNWEGDDHLPK
jgi:hypothetical protein